MSTPLRLAVVLTLLVTAGSATAHPNHVETPKVTVHDDGTVTVEGIELPGQNVAVPDDIANIANRSERVLKAAEMLLEQLDDEQMTEAVLKLSADNAARWSNLPPPLGKRNGLRFDEMSAAQIEAACVMLKVAMGDETDNGYAEAMQLRMADDVDALLPGRDERGFDYTSGAYTIAMLGKPSPDAAWMLQFGGHHLAINVTFKGGKIESFTPLHTGSEPIIWKDGEQIYAPLADDHGAMVTLLAALNDEQTATAKLDESFRDMLLGPGQDGQFPAGKQGICVGDLNDEQKALVLAAMRPWVMDANQDTAAELLAVYQKELDETYLAFSGTPTLSEHGDYVRLDGPSVWIELSCQPTDMQPGHYHTVWRDRQRDYGALFKFGD